MRMRPITILNVASALLFAAALATSIMRTAPVAAAADEPGAGPVDALVAVEDTAPQAVPPTPQAGYVGAETCATCHDGYDASLQATKHGRSTDPRSPAATQGCESCHGPGEEHVNGGGDTSKIRFFAKGGATPAETSETCATCHNRGEHALWEGSQHESRGLTCTTCHSVHKPQSEVAQLNAADQRGVCVTCHRDKIAKLDRSGHMPVREGKLECSTCHNPHGATNVRLLRTGDSIAEACTSCHAEKRGPYLWEHPPSRDGCTTCHDPHGSANERMLVSRAPILCQRCHAHTRHPSTIYDAGAVGTSARVFARSCVTCHSAIHGSNHPAGQRFVR